MSKNIETHIQKPSNILVIEVCSSFDEIQTNNIVQNIVQVEQILKDSLC